jgi:hypothetical protein
MTSQNESSEEDALNSLLTVLRKPSASLPETIDEKFLAGILHFVNADVRRMHQDRLWIRSVTGFPWPEEKPSVDDMPALYAEALKYPSFAIVVQHQFFPEDLFRGLPKHQLRRQYHELVKRARREKPLPRHEKHLRVLEAIQVREIGGDLNLVLGELLGVPGHLAWHAKCELATDGLTRLEVKEELAPMARYLRDIVGPFKDFGEETTIGELFESTVIPRALRRPMLADPGADMEQTDSSSNSTSTQGSVGYDVVREPIDVPISSAMDSLESIEEYWQIACVQIETIAGIAKNSGPVDNHFGSLREQIARLEELHDAFSHLKPKGLSTEETLVALRETIVGASAGLNELIGESLNAPLLLSRLFEVSEVANDNSIQEATTLCQEAEKLLVEATSLATEIGKLMAALPIRKARDETGPLLDQRENVLRQVLGIAERAIDLLPLSIEAGPPIELPNEKRSGENAAQSASDQFASPSDTADRAEDFVDVTVGEISEPYDPNMTFAPAVAEPTPPVELQTADPLRDDIVRRLDYLFEIGEHGLAFHLHGAASQVMPASDLPYTATELRLAAAGGRTIGLPGPDHFSLAEQRGEALSIAQFLSEQNDDRSLARRNLLLAGALPAALFRAEDVAAVSLVESIGGKGPFAHYFKLVEVVEENRKRGFPLTPANVLAIEAHSRDDSFVKHAVAKIKEAVEGFKASRFRFQLGEKIKHWLSGPQGLLGRLASELTNTETAIARLVAEELNGRDRITNYVDRITTDVGTGQEIDGVARERLLSVLSDIGHQCSDLVQAIDGFDALRRSTGRLDTIRRLRDLALVGIDDVLAEAEISGSLLGASRVQATPILRTLASVLKGGMVEREAAPLAVDLHGPLLWLPQLTWTGGWTPSPYDPDRIIQEIMTIDVPLLKDPAVSLKKAFEARRLESAFVPAYMLLNISRWFDVNKEEADALRGKLDADKDTKKSQVSERLKGAERLVEKMRRMAVGSLDQSARLKETLSTINPKNLPVELPSSFLPETLTGDRVEDFNSALARIRDVEAEAQREFEKATVDYSTQIDELKGLGNLDPTTEVELRNLLERHEFTTLADWLNMLRTGGVRKPLLPSGVINKRLAWFRSVLPQLGSLEPLQTARAVDSGGDVGPLDYSGLDDDRREEGAKILRGFPDLKRLIKDQRGSNADAIRGKVVEVASQVLYDVTQCTEDPVLSRIRQQIHIFDAKVTLPPTDPASLVLPEFGSATQGSWRICVVTPTISQQALIDLADLAGSRGVAVLYLGVLNSERREQLRIDLNKRKRAMLVIDEALVGATIADLEDRRRAVIEIAQGYSSADPYITESRRFPLRCSRGVLGNAVRLLIRLDPTWFTAGDGSARPRSFSRSTRCSLLMRSSLTSTWTWWATLRTLSSRCRARSVRTSSNRPFARETPFRPRSQLGSMRTNAAVCSC